MNPLGYHMPFLPQPPSSCSVDPPDCTVLCYSISEYTPIVNEGQAIDGVGVSKPTYVVIHEEYD